VTSGSSDDDRETTSQTAEFTPWHSHEPMQRYDSLFPLLPDFVAKHTIGNRFLPNVGFEARPSAGLWKKVFAALVSEQMGISLAHAERRYPLEFNQSHWLGLTDRIDAIYSEALAHLDSFLALRKTQADRYNRSLATFSDQFFYRNLGSLDAAKRLSELGYLCEVAAILRSSLEQFAFSAKLDSTGKSEDVAAIRPVQCLNHLKKFVPAAGRLYGLTSKYAHFEFDHHTHFFARSPTEVQTIQRAPVLRAYSTHLVFAVLACVSQYALNILESSVLTIQGPSEEIRKTIDAIDRYSDDVCEILKMDAVLGEIDILIHEIATTASKAN
jgi:hypothetical protein